METQTIAVHAITVTARKRPVDPAVVAEIQQSIQQQGLLQNIGVQETETGYRLVFGAHRLEAVKALGWTEIQCRVFSPETSDDECLLAELQENNARKELTGAERKAFAAEVGRILAKIKENGQTDFLANGQNESNGHWLVKMAKTSGTPFKTLQNWWFAFTQSAGLTLTPKQAGTAEKQAFFAWLDVQQRMEAQAKAEKVAAADAEKQRKAEAAEAQRLDAERLDLIGYLDITAAECGRELVVKWVKEWLVMTAVPAVPAFPVPAHNERVLYALSIFSWIKGHPDCTRDEFVEMLERIEAMFARPCNGGEAP